MSDRTEWEAAAWCRTVVARGGTLGFFSPGGEEYEERVSRTADQFAAELTSQTVPRAVADRLAEAIEKACDIANNRWSEWGGRAERVEEEIKKALAEYQEATKP